MQWENKYSEKYEYPALRHRLFVRKLVSEIDAKLEYI